MLLMVYCLNMSQEEINKDEQNGPDHSPTREEREEALQEALANVPDEFRHLPLNEKGKHPELGWANVKRDDYTIHPYGPENTKSLIKFAEDLGALLNSERAGDPEARITKERLRELALLADVTAQSGAASSVATSILLEGTDLRQFVSDVYPLPEKPKESRRRRFGKKVLKKLLPRQRSS